MKFVQYLVFVTVLTIGSIVSYHVGNDNGFTDGLESAKKLYFPSELPQTGEVQIFYYELEEYPNDPDYGL